MRSSQRTPRVRLESDAYQDLVKEVLARDGWRCQWCGARSNLEVHHIRFRSRGGDDTIDNLITLCADCHNALHGRGGHRCR